MSKDLDENGDFKESIYHGYDQFVWSMRESALTGLVNCGDIEPPGTFKSCGSPKDSAVGHLGNYLLNSWRWVECANLMLDRMRLEYPNSILIVDSEDHVPF